MAYRQTFAREIYEKKMVADCHTVAPRRKNRPMVHEEPGRWPRKAGGRSSQCSFCVKLSVHENAVVGSRWALKPGFTVYSGVRYALPPGRIMYKLPVYYPFLVSTMSRHTRLPSKPLIISSPRSSLSSSFIQLSSSFFLACDISFFFSGATHESVPTQQSHIDASEPSQSDGKSEDVSTAICNLAHMHWKTLDI